MRVVLPLAHQAGCMARCGIYRNQPYFEGAEKSTMAALAEWVVDSDKVLTF